MNCSGPGPGAGPEVSWLARGAGGQSGGRDGGVGSDAEAHARTGNRKIPTASGFSLFHSYRAPTACLHCADTGDTEKYKTQSPSPRSLQSSHGELLQGTQCLLA